MGVAPGEDVEDADLVVTEYHSDEEKPADDVMKRCVGGVCTL